MENRLNGLTRTESAQKAGFTGRAVRSPKKLIETPELKQRMQAAFRKQGVTLSAIATVYAEGMAATLVESTKEGMNETNIPDRAERRKSASEAAKLWGLGEQVKQDGNGAALTLTLNGPLAERLAAHMTGVGK